MRDFVYIIAEFNPPHKGHAYLISELRRLFPDAAFTAIMSGHFTERGSPAIADKFLRARAAISLGCDLVISIPFPCSASSAENFARGGVTVAAAFADAFPDFRHVLAFGSECGDTEKLVRAASRSSDDEYRRRLYSVCNGGHNARDMRAVYAELYGEDEARILDGANDMLGIEYIRAIGGSGSPIIPLALRRVGAAHDGAPAGGIASASYIRGLLSNGDEAAWSYLPASVSELMRRHGIIDEARIKTAIHAILRMTDPDVADTFSECGGGIGRRLVRAALEGGTYDEMMSIAATKQYTNARLRRAALMAAAGVAASDTTLPAYTQLLAANAVGTSVLHRYSGRLPVLTKPADKDKLPQNAQRQAELESRADRLYTLGFTPPVPAARFTQAAPWIEKT